MRFTAFGLLGCSQDWNFESLRAIFVGFTPFCHLGCSQDWVLGCLRVEFGDERRNEK